MPCELAATACCRRGTSCSPGRALPDGRVGLGRGRLVTKRSTAGTAKPPPWQRHHERWQCTHGYRGLGGESERRGEVTDTDNVRLPLCAQKP